MPYMNTELYIIIFRKVVYVYVLSEEEMVD